MTGADCPKAVVAQRKHKKQKAQIVVFIRFILCGGHCLRMNELEECRSSASSGGRMGNLDTRTGRLGFELGDAERGQEQGFAHMWKMGVMEGRFEQILAGDK